MLQLELLTRSLSCNLRLIAPSSIWISNRSKWWLSIQSATTMPALDCGFLNLLGTEWTRFHSLPPFANSELGTEEYPTATLCVVSIPVSSSDVRVRREELAAPPPSPLRVP